MKRKDYQKPTMKVVKLEHYCDILAGSMEANRSGYGTAVEETWDDSSSSRRREGYNWDDEENEEEF